MTDETTKPVPPTKPKLKLVIKPKPKPPEREQSTIGFPYNDLETATNVARAIHNAGATAVTREQLAGLMDTTTNSGTFLNKLSATKMFGLISTSLGKVGLTELGFSILDTDERRARKARADAFLSVPLFRRLYEDFRGRQLPPRPLGLEQAIVKFGVSSNQKTTARLTFDKSAALAGFFPNGIDRLIEPIIAQPGLSVRAVLTSDEGASEREANAERFASAMDAGIRRPARSDLHPFVQGLIDALPAPESTWTIEGRAKWLQAAANNFDLMYKGNGTITIIAKAEHGEGKEKTES